MTVSRKNQALIRALINPGKCDRLEGELSPKVLLRFGYKRSTTEPFSQRCLRGSVVYPSQTNGVGVARFGREASASVQRI